MYGMEASQQSFRHTDILSHYILRDRFDSYCSRNTWLVCSFLPFSNGCEAHEVMQSCRVQSGGVKTCLKASMRQVFWLVPTDDGWFCARSDVSVHKLFMPANILPSNGVMWQKFVNLVCEDYLCC